MGVFVAGLRAGRSSLEMIRRKSVLLGVAELILYGVVVPHPEALMDPVLRKADELLEDEVLVAQVMAALGKRFQYSVSRGRYGTPAGGPRAARPV